MSKARERCHRGRAIADPVPPAPRIATLSVRPLRLAFLIDANARADELLRYVRYNTSIWGGRANLLIPVHENVIRNGWWESLLRYEPDRGVLCSGVPTELGARVQQQVQPFEVVCWSDDVAEHHAQGIDRVGGVHILQVLMPVYEELRGAQRSNFRIPSCPIASPFHLCAAAQFGLLDDELSEFYERALKAEPIGLAGDSLHTYLDGVSQFRGRLFPLMATDHNLSCHTDPSGSHMGGNLVILGQTSPAEDLALFWNLRASARMLSKRTVALPSQALQDDEAVRALAQWCNEHFEGTNALTLASASLGLERLLSFRDRLRVLLSDRFLYDVWYEDFSFPRFRLREDEHHSEVYPVGRSLYMRLPKPTWREYERGLMQWAVDVDLEGPSATGQGYVPPKYPRLNELLAEGTDRRWRGRYFLRTSHDRLSLRVTANADHVCINLPDDERLFVDILRSKGYTAATTDKCRYAAAIMKLLADHRAAGRSRDPGVRHLLRQMRTHNAALTLGEMASHLRQGQTAMPPGQIEEFIADLALNGVLLRGYDLHCPNCDLRRWYAVAEIGENTECAGCLSRFQPPLNAPFHYRLNELVLRGVQQSVMPVLLADLALSALCWKSYLSVLGIEVKRAPTVKVDIDIVAACDGNLVLAECKDLEHGVGKQTLTDVGEQLAGVVSVADNVGARIVVLATLLDEVPADLQRCLSELREGHPDLRIHLAVKRDLERGYLVRDGIDELATLAALLPRRTQAPGHVRDSGQRFCGM